MEVSLYRKERYSRLGPQVAKALVKRHFDAWYVDNMADGVEKALSLIPKTDTVAWGGSMTCKESGLIQKIIDGGWKVINRDSAKTPEERQDLMRRALLCDTFLMSANAITEDGELLNIDGMGNRVAALLFGPKQVLVLAGLNKVCKTLEDARSRARAIAAPENGQRFTTSNTPCLKTGTCENCLSADSICNYFVTVRQCRPAGRVKVILVGEDWGM
jgi:L-lactate utilization protein LutB